MDKDRRNEFRAALALKYTLHLGPRSWKRLLQEFGGAYGAFCNRDRWPGGSSLTRAAQSFRKETYRERAAVEFEAAQDLGLDTVLWTDPDYPERLRHIIDPPLFLYCAGRRDLLHGPAVAAVGSRKCSTRGLALASRICEGLSTAGVTVVSGMAKGIDRQAHLSGLSGPGSSIAVLGTGLDLIYPSSNADLYHRLCGEGLILTEFAPGIEPLPQHFPYRNRIVSGLSLGVIVVEAAKRSGSRITARLGLEQGREVYAVPPPGEGDVSEGCDELVEQGARSVTSAGEVILDLATLIKADAQRLKQARAAVPPSQLRLDTECSGVETLSPSAGTGSRNEGQPDVLAASNSQCLSSLQVSSDAPGAQPSKRFPSAAATPASDFADASDGPEDSEQQAVLEQLANGGRKHIDQLARDLDWEIGRLSRLLTVMEVMGVVRQWPGTIYGLE